MTGTKFIDYHGGRLWYTEEGSGEAVVFLHGFLESKEIWGDFTRSLIPAYHVITIDLPGHGLSSVFSDMHTMAFMAECVKEVIHSLGLGKVVVVGHSMGGYVSLAFAEKYPESLAGLCLFHSSPYPDNGEKKKNRDRTIDVVKQGKKNQLVAMHIPMTFAPANRPLFGKIIERLKETAMHTPDNGIIAAVAGMRDRPDRSEILHLLNIPVLIIAGANDSFISTDVSENIFRLPGNPLPLMLEMSGHMGFIEEKEKALEGLKDYLNIIYPAE